MDKRKLYNACVELLTNKTSIARQNMEEAQASANNETKSSAGDKYETGRAMSQQERDLHARQLAELINTQKILSSIDPEKACQKVELGALVETSTALFFIAGSLGAITFEEKQVMVISAVSPIAQAMLDKHPGDEFEWMKKRVKILQTS